MNNSFALLPGGNIDVYFSPEVTLKAVTTPVDGSSLDGLLDLATRVCYKSVGTSEDTARFLESLGRRKHYTPFEFANFVFHVKGIDRSCSHQIVRHDNPVLQLSTRYCPFLKMGIVADPDLPIELYTNSLFAFFKAQSRIEGSKLTLPEYILQKLNPEQKTSKKVLEQSRKFLPAFIATELMIAMDLRNLAAFASIRGSGHASKDIRAVAGMLKQEAQKCLDMDIDSIVEAMGQESERGGLQ
jgi:flavin-dependent thymidylate synthase